MSRIRFLILGAVAALGVVTAHAQTVSQSLSAEQVQSEFAAAGYQIDQAVSWTWSTPGLTTFRVRDRASDRVLMVFVYPDQASADLAREQAGRLEADPSPRLVPGYGPSEWQANVALVQSSESDLRRVLNTEYEREIGFVGYEFVGYESREIASGYAVDLEFALLLRGAFLNL